MRRYLLQLLANSQSNRGAVLSVFALNVSFSMKQAQSKSSKRGRHGSATGVETEDAPVTPATGADDAAAAAAASGSESDQGSIRTELVAMQAASKDQGVHKPGYRPTSGQLRREMVKTEAALAEVARLEKVLLAERAAYAALDVAVNQTAETLEHTQAAVVRLAARLAYNKYAVSACLL